MFQFVYSSTYREVYSFIEKCDIGFRNEFHLKFKDWKDKKKYSQNSVESYFPKSGNSPPPPGAVKKNLVNGEDFEKEKKLAEERIQKEMEERKQRKTKKKARNCV